MRVFIVVFASLLLSSSAASQVPVELVTPSPTLDGRFGASVSSIADQDDDGVPDVLVGARGESAPGLAAAGRVHVFSGATGALLRSLDPPSPTEGDGFGAGLDTAGDLDGDGVGDVVVGAPGKDSGRVYVFSGATGLMLYELSSPSANTAGRFGRSVARLSDVDSDGVPDLLVGAPGETVATGGQPVESAGQAHVFSGADGTFLYSVVADVPQSGMAFGVSVDGANDVDADGIGDLLLSAPRADVDLGAGPLEDAGQVFLASGADGSILLLLESPAPFVQARLGQSLARIGDLNGDGLQEVLASEEGRAYVFSADDGSLIRQFANPSGDPDSGFGRAIAGTGDVDDDGLADVFVSSPGEAVPDPNSPTLIPDAGRAYVFSTQTGAAVRQIDSPRPETGGEFGAVARRVGDVNGDNVADLLIGAPGEASGGVLRAGRAYIVLNPPAVSTEAPAPSGPGLSVWPNPATDRLRVNASGAQTVWVYDALGRVVTTVRPDARGVTLLDTRSWSAGVYMVRAGGPGGLQTETLSIVR